MAPGLIVAEAGAALRKEIALLADHLRGLMRRRAGVAEGLVLRRRTPTGRLRREVDGLERLLVRVHTVRTEPALRAAGGRTKSGRLWVSRLEADHRVVQTSFTQLRCLYAMLVSD